MTPEPSSAKMVPAPANSQASGERGGALTRVVLLVLLLPWLCWNLFLLGILFASMPKNDFGRPFWSTLAFLRGEDMYALNESVVYLFKGTTILHLWDLNPPHAHLLLLPLAVLPPRLALLVWCILGGLCLYASIRIILSQIGLELTPSQKEWMVLGLLAFTGMGTAVVTGHLSFPLMLLITLAWSDARHGRWSKAGAWLGLGMSLKPFLLIFIPYLVVKGYWRALAAAGLSAGCAFLLGLLVFGPENHRSWVRVLSLAETWAWLPMNASLYGIMGRGLLKNPGFTPMTELDPGLVRAVWLVLVILAGLATLLRSCTDSSEQNCDRAFAILLVSALLLSPLGWTYYFWLPAVPIAPLVRGWWIQRSTSVGKDSPPPCSLSWNLFLAAAPGLFTPITLALAGQPSALATVVIGGISFWSLLLVWLALIVDGLDLRSIAATAGSCSRFAQGIKRFRIPFGSATEP